MTGFVYAIECSMRVKIGFSEDPIRRLNKVASDAPFPCALLGYWPGTRADELDVQTKFNAIRLHGEWFAATVELMGFVGQMSTMDGTVGKPKVAPPVALSAKEDWPAVVARILYLKDWRQGDLAAHLNVAQPVISRWLNGVVSPRTESRDQMRALLAHCEAAE